MNLLLENKKNYFIVMITEFIMLSSIYWLFFTFCFSSVLVYLLATSFYITEYRFWLKIFKEKKHLIFDNNEHFLLFNTIILNIILAINSLLPPNQMISMFFVLITISIIFICYYIFRLKKQKKSTVSTTKFCGIYKFISIMSSIFLVFDLIVWICDRMNILLLLYIPILFGIFTLLFFIYKKEFYFNSILPVILFLSVYILSSTLLVLNSIITNFFTFTIIVHFIIFSSIFNCFMSNSTLTKNDEILYRKNIMSLIFANIVLIFICLNNILLFQLPQIIVSYLYFITIILINYIAYYNYKFE